MPSASTSSQLHVIARGADSPREPDQRDDKGQDPQCRRRWQTRRPQCLMASIPGDRLPCAVRGRQIPKIRQDRKRSRQSSREIRFLRFALKYRSRTDDARTQPAARHRIGRKSASLESFRKQAKTRRGGRATGPHFRRSSCSGRIPLHALELHAPHCTSSPTGTESELVNCDTGRSLCEGFRRNGKQFTTSGRRP